MSINAGTLILDDAVNPDGEIHAISVAETCAEETRKHLGSNFPLPGHDVKSAEIREIRALAGLF